MVVIGLLEVFNLAVLTAAIGYIFTGYIRTPEHMRLGFKRARFNWQDFKFAIDKVYSVI